MFSASRYAPGLIGVGILWILANSTTNSWVATDLTSRASAAIPAEALDKPVVSVSGRDVTLAGFAFSPAGAEAAKAAADATSGVRLVFATTPALAVAKPYLFGAARDGGKIVLTGNVPDPATRAKLLAAAKAAVPGSSVTDQMTYAAGAPAGFAAQTAFALAELANFSKASSSLSDTAYSLSGEAASQAGFDAATASVKKLAEGLILAKAEILPSAAQIAAGKAAADQASADAAAKLAADKAAADAAAKLAADKVAADAAAKLAADKATADAAAKLAADKAAADAAAKLAADKAAADAAAKLEADKAAADAVAKLAADKATADAAAKLAADEATADAAAKPAATATATAVVAANAATDAADETSPLDAPACQSKFNAQLLEGTIEFQTGKADIHPKSEKFLDLLVKTGRRCPKARIEVSGYTDSVGASDANVALSARRAEAVMDYLVKAGLDAGLLTAKGYGEANPVASNDTPEGRAKNRRIEFIVQD